jgi:hypothetical protein
MRVTRSFSASLTLIIFFVGSHCALGSGKALALGKKLTTAIFDEAESRVYGGSLARRVADGRSEG